MAKKDVAGCDKLREGAEQPMIRRCPNGATLSLLSERTIILQGIVECTWRIETS